MQTLAEIKLLLDEAGLAPRHALGQNFLIDKNLLARLAGAAGVAAGDLVLEVGPGTGTLTETLLEQGARVVACELDRGLADLLRARLKDRSPQFTLIEGDCLGKHRTLNAEVAETLAGERFALVANLPYAAATPLMITLAIAHPKCHTQAVTIQREVADRLMADVGTDEYGALSVVMQSMYTMEQLAVLPPACFWPRPDVTIAMVLARRRAEPLTDAPMALLKLCQRLFSARRKQIGTTLGRAMVLPEGVQPTMRPQELSAAQFVQLLDVLPADETR